MKYDNRMKGWITQTLFRVLLEDAKFSVVPFGYEDVFREINHFDEEFFKTADVPNALYKMPDFIVADQGKKNLYVFEVKYRNEMTDDHLQDLEKTLKKQVMNWSPIYLLLYIGKLNEGQNDTPANYIKVIKICKSHVGELLFFNKKENTLPWKCVTLRDFGRIQDLFSELKDKEQAENLTLTKIVPMIKAFHDIDEIDTKQQDFLKRINCDNHNCL